jgi:uncharacterized membrane protein
VLVHRRRLRPDLLQALAVLVSASLGFWMPQITAGPTVESAVAVSLLNGIAAGVLTFVGIVYSLLFLVVQFGSTTMTPRLNLFRDDPIVWHEQAHEVAE